MIVRKLGAPMEPELAMGAIASGGIRMLNDQVVKDLAISKESIERVALAEQQELDRREHSYRGDRPQPRLDGQTVILVDDGIATGSTIRAGVAATRRRGAARVIAAVPVAPVDTLRALAREGIEVVCLAQPACFFGISQFYRDFAQLTDDQVTSILARAEHEHASVAVPTPAPS
jgi:putative phosphoribosyl transferase